METPASVYLDRPLDEPVGRASVQADTTVLGYWTFESGGYGDPQGWVPHDLTEQTGCYWHVEDFSGLGGGDFGGLVVLEGTQSLWCGARPDTGSVILCGYATLPGYGNNWDQSWCFKCIEVPDTEAVFIEYLTAWDSEPGYDYFSLEYATKSTCDSLDNIDDIHINNWVQLVSVDGVSPKVFLRDTIPAGHEGAIKIRFRFTSDGSWSDRDGLWDTDGAVIIDSVTVGNPYTVFDFEDFEDESPGDLATTDGDWECAVMSGYGDCSALFPGAFMVQEDACEVNLTWLWAFIKGSTETYACGGYPDQIAVPKGNHRGQYIHNEIWSPKIEFSGSGSTVQFVFDRYNDNPIPGLVFGVWHIRSWVNGCPGDWKERSFIYYATMRGWLRSVQSVSDLINPDASYLQVALGVVDMCGYWYLVYGDCSCHSHAPLYDNVELYRISTWGPEWSVLDIDLFNDTFPENGTSVGTGRIDMALDVAPQYNANLILPGDSATVTVSDLVSGLREPEPNTGFGAAVYFYLAVDPVRPLNPALIEENGFRWPLVDSLICNSRMWYQFRLDTAFTEPSGPRTGPVPDRFCIDVNDHYFFNGDTLLFFFGAENANNRWTWWSQESGTVATLEACCAAPMEMQILPAHGGLDGDILYVDNFSGRGAQPYFDSAFEILGIAEQVDRYDKRGPPSCVSNSIGHRCNNVLTQLIPNYRKIIWNSGDLSAGTMGDGTGTPEKADDFTAIMTFLSQHIDSTGSGFYFSGDDGAQEWAGLAGASALAFNNVYIPHTVTTGNHVTAHGITPLVVGTNDGIFDRGSPTHGSPSGVDSIVALGSCPIINDFDQIQPVGGTTLEMTYSGTGLPTDGAVVAHTTLNDLGNPVGVVLSGFSYHYIRDAYIAGIPARVDHLRDILQWLGNILSEPTGAGETLAFKNELAQNYPNPFNPTTTIRYSIEKKGHVSLKIYNVAGRLIRTLVSGIKNPRPEGFTVTWDGRNESGQAVSSGIYFCKLATRFYTQTRKLVFVK